MTPLTSETIALILHYIVPPSQLSPLPPHLISSSLRQRLHFLNISPENPDSYLAWPSDNHHLAIRLLEQFQKPIDDHLYSSFPIRYTSDPESAYAHVSILPELNPGLRLIFQWNNPDGWKYHNIALMPFPPHSSESFQDLSPSQSETTMSDDQLDAYWDAYTHPDDSQSPSPTSSNLQHAVEDSYWSQYAAIQGNHNFIHLRRVHSFLVTGSGDSTLPTPPSLDQKQNDSKRIFVSYPGLPPNAVFDPLKAPSPNALARRLEELSPRFKAPPLDDDSNSGSVSESLTFSPPSNPPLSSSTVLLSIDADWRLSEGSLVGECAYQQDPQHMVPHHESHEALKDAIRGVYRLWKSARAPDSAIPEGEEFLEMVGQIVAEASLN